MNNQKNPMVQFFAQVLQGFSIAIIAVSIFGTLIGNDAMHVSTMFRLGSQGLTYDTMLQIFLYIIIIQALRTFLFSNAVIKGMLFLWKIVLLMAAGLLIAGVFAISFQWVPLYNWEAWLGFVLSYSFCTGMITAVMVIKTKLEDRKYGRLLSDYKAKLQKESGE